MNQEIYKSFNDQIFLRLQKSIFTTEDSVRYTFFAALLKHTTLATYDMILELPHNTIKGAEIDLFIGNHEGNEVVAEFKYDRAIPCGKNLPHPQKAGKLFNDVKRLLDFEASLSAMRLFIYLTDNEMASYMRNPNNNLKDYFDLKPNNQMRIDQSFFSNRCKTFRTSARGGFTANIQCEWSDTLPHNNELRVYKIYK